MLVQLPDLLGEEEDGDDDEDWARCLSTTTGKGCSLELSIKLQLDRFSPRCVRSGDNLEEDSVNGGILMIRAVYLNWPQKMA